MLYMVIERFKEGAAPEVYRRARARGDRTPEKPRFLPALDDRSDHVPYSKHSYIHTGEPRQNRVYRKEHNSLDLCSQV